ncbi:hypothetical protein QYF36_013798 [Acer negundo]|nr:hypothetical protein QYF36_013798 [Acer negundo]
MASSQYLIFQVNCYMQRSSFSHNSNHFKTLLCFQGRVASSTFHDKKQCFQDHQGCFCESNFAPVDELEEAALITSIEENHKPQEINISTLETLGNWDVNTTWNRPFTSHPKWSTRRSSPERACLVYHLPSTLPRQRSSTAINISVFTFVVPLPRHLNVQRYER